MDSLGSKELANTAVWGKGGGLPALAHCQASTKTRSAKYGVFTFLFVRSRGPHLIKSCINLIYSLFTLRSLSIDAFLRVNLLSKWYTIPAQNYPSVQQLYIWSFHFNNSIHRAVHYYILNTSSYTFLDYIKNNLLVDIIQAISVYSVYQEMSK